MSSSHNIINENSGLTGEVAERFATYLGAFFLFINIEIMTIILQYVNHKGEECFVIAWKNLRDMSYLHT